MVLTCDDRVSPGEMMRFGAVAGNCVLVCAVEAGGLPQLCPSEISERTAARMSNVWRIREATWAWLHERGHPLAWPSEGAGRCADARAR